MRQRGALDLDGASRFPIVLLLASRDLAKHQFRGTSVYYFLIMSVVILIILAVRGLVEAEELPLGVALVPAAILGKAIGTAFLKRISEAASRTLSLRMAILTAILGGATAAWVLI